MRTEKVGILAVSVGFALVLGLVSCKQPPNPVSVVPILTASPTQEPTNIVTPVLTPSACVVIEATFDSPVSCATETGGLTWDGTNLVLGGDSGCAYFWKIDSSGNTIAVVQSNRQNYGLAWQGPDTLWVACYWSPAYEIHKIVTPDWGAMDLGGVSLIFGTPGNPLTVGGKYPKGLAYDGTDLWMMGNNNSAGPEASFPPYDNVLYELTTAGVVLNEYSPLPDNVYGYGVTWDGSHLWVTATNGLDGFIYQIDNSNGQVLGTYCFSQPVVLRDVTWDGSYFWVSAGAKIYKISIP